MTRILAIFSFVLMAAAGLFGQIRFEAVSIRPSNFVPGHMRITMTGGPGTADPGRVTFTNYVLSDLISKAYGFDISEMSGPDWLMNPGMNSPRFDIIAKLPDGATPEEFQLMLRDMLTGRFKMLVHREAKERPIFNLAVAKNPPKLTRSVTPPVLSSPASDGFPALPLGEDTQVFNKTGGTRMQAVGVSMETLAARFSKRAGLGRPVRDTTGLSGPYDFVLSWQIQEAPPEANSLPALFEALQKQLGLRLVPETGSVETLVIDHLEKNPTEN